MKKIPLTNGGFARVSDCRFKKVSKFKWYKWSPDKSKGIWYARRTTDDMPMQLFILGTKKQVDHKDRNGLNNQDNNLRVATNSQNGANHGLQSNNTSGFKGVYWSIVAQKWMAYIMLNRKRIHLGLFVDILDAARAYDKAARRLFGKFACTNKMLGLL